MTNVNKAGAYEVGATRCDAPSEAEIWTHTPLLLRKELLGFATHARAMRESASVIWAVLNSADWFLGLFIVCCISYHENFWNIGDS